MPYSPNVNTNDWGGSGGNMQWNHIEPDPLASGPGSAYGWPTEKRDTPSVVVEAPTPEKEWPSADIGLEDPVVAVDDKDFWISNREWFISRGYKIQRPPSSETSSQKTQKKKKKGKKVQGDNDSNSPPIMVATRMSDGDMVRLKKMPISAPGEEYSIITYFSGDPVASDPQNHCMPVLEYIEIPKYEDLIILVMPMVEDLSDAHFITRDDCIEFFRQIFEGVQFIHRHGTAHRNFTWNNFKVKMPTATDGLTLPKYYLDNFELSKYYDTEQGAVKDFPIVGSDETVPEFQGDQYNEPCDPFAVDVYYIGNIIKTKFTDLKVEVDFMLPIVADMMQDNPLDRPTMEDVVWRFDEIFRAIKNSETVTPAARKNVTRAKPSRSWSSRFTRPFRRRESVMPDDFLPIDTSNGSSTQLWGDREVVLTVPSSAQPFPPHLEIYKKSIFTKMIEFFRGNRPWQIQRLESSRKEIYNRPACTYVITVPVPPDYSIQLQTGPPDKWDCRQCGEHLMTRSKFVKHTRYYHPDSFLCGCGKLYSNAADLLDHRKDYAHYY